MAHDTTPSPPAVAEPPARGVVAQALAAERLDLLVIGGGIVGAGLARDAAQRGLRTGLIEQHDFAAGTSSRTSRLLHGGLRYLAQGRLLLVREAQHEKRNLHRIAPHLAAPLPFVFPAYRGAAWPLWQLRLGVKLYDLLCGRAGNLGASEGLTAEQAAARVPGLARAGLRGAVRYYDGFTNDARLVLDTLRSAARHGALLLNYCCCTEAVRTAEGFRCTVRDGETGGELSIAARAVVAAAGPWAMRLPKHSLSLRLTKGVHLVLPRERLPMPEAVVLTEGNRVLFVIPWGERVILGTTDTDFDGRPEDVGVEPADTRYLLAVADRHFPEARLTDRDVLSAWAGVRPLLADPRGGPSDISRSHVLKMNEPGWFELAGGKLTTYRLMAEQAVDRVVRHLERTAAPCRTAEEPLLAPGEAEGVSGLLPPPVSHSAVEHYCRREWARHLADVMVRRTSWHYYLPDARAAARQVAGWMAEIQGWDGARREEELGSYRKQA